MKRPERRREDWWSWRCLLRRARGWAAPRRNDMLARRWREAGQQREAHPASHCQKTAAKTWSYNIALFW